MSDDTLSPDEQRELDDIAALLADESLWLEPLAAVEDRVAAGIAAERAQLISTPSSRLDRSAGEPASRLRRIAPLVAAGFVVAACASVITSLVMRSPADEPDAAAALVGTELAPGVSGTVDVTAVSSGLRLDIRLPGLPRRDGGEFYQVWLKNCAGDRLVPAGSFHEMDDAVAWAGVGVDEFPLLTITREAAAAPKAAEQGSSGEVVAAATIGEACAP